MPQLKKTLTQAPKSRVDEANEKIKGAQVDPFAKKYAETEAATGTGYVPPPPGKYEALIIDAQGIREDGSKKEYAFLEFVLVNCEDSELDGKKIRIFYNFTKEDGSEGEGWPYFKSALEMLGGTSPTDWDDMCDTLSEIAKDQTWVIINVVKNRKGNKEYTNAYLQSVPENQAEKPDASPF